MDLLALLDQVYLELLLIHYLPLDLLVQLDHLFHLGLLDQLDLEYLVYHLTLHFQLLLWDL